MKIKVVLILTVIVVAISVLLISILRTASIEYNFTSPAPLKNNESDPTGEGEVFIDYYLPYEGSVLPNSVFWPFKAMRDRIWMLVTPDLQSRAELNLHFADKRLVMARKLFEQGEYELGYSTLSKAGKYLEQACMLEETIRAEGDDTVPFAETLIKASIKHREQIRKIAEIAPEDAVAKVMIVEDFAKNVYKMKSPVLEKAGRPLPIDPFSGE